MVFKRGEENRKLAAEGLRRCCKCSELKSVESFNFRSSGKYRKSSCRDCDSRYWKDFYGKNSEQVKGRAREYHKTWKVARWHQVLDALGHTCACCGETNESFLTVDHINRDGHKTRGYKVSKNGKTYRSTEAGRALWSKVRREGYPKDKYQVLCFNCNMGRERHEGICPHVNEPVPLGLCA